MKAGSPGASAGNDGYAIRRATPADVAALVAFTLREAREAEGLELDAAAAEKGVRGGFEDPRRATCWLAQAADGRIVASISVTTEWSNFHGGEYWWIQSLYVAPEHRGRGLVERLLDHLWTVARESNALDLRLYAHRSNARALRAYERCGFTVSPYIILTRARKHHG